MKQEILLQIIESSMNEVESEIKLVYRLYYVKFPGLASRDFSIVASSLDLIPLELKSPTLRIEQDVFFSFYDFVYHQTISNDHNQNYNGVSDEIYHTHGYYDETGHWQKEQDGRYP